MQFGGQAHPTAGLTQRRRSQGGSGVLPEPVLAEDDARCGAELRQGQQQPGVLLPLAGAVERQHGVRGGAQQIPDPGAFGTSRARDRRPGIGVRVDHVRCRVRVRHLPGHFLGSHQHVEDAGDRGRGPLGTDDGVDDAVLVQVLPGLHIVRELLPVDGFEHAGPEEADERSGFGHGDMSQGSPGGEDAAGGRVAQVDEVGQTGPFVGDDGVGDLDHRQEGDRALLHPRPARGGSGQQRQPFERGPFDGVDEAFGRGDADRAGEEAEFADDHGHAASGDRALAGDDGLVDPRLVGSGGELGCIGLGDSAGWSDGCGIPGSEGSLVEDDVDEFVCVQTWHDDPLSSRRPTRPRSIRRPRRAAAGPHAGCGWSRPRRRRRRRRTAAAARAGRCRRAPGGRRRP